MTEYSNPKQRGRTSRTSHPGLDHRRFGISDLLRIPSAAGGFGFRICALLTAATLVAYAGEAHVKFVKFAEEAGVWRIDVTVQHDDEGWEHYANAWRVVTADETRKELAKRVLEHPHTKEPFTRSLTGVKLPPGIQKVIIEAHDKVHEYGGETVTVDLSLKSGPNFEVVRGGGGQSAAQDGSELEKVPEWLKSEDPRLRAKALNTVAALQPKSLPELALATLRNDRDERVRAVALACVAKLPTKDAKAVDVLMQALSDESVKLQKAAAALLKGITGQSFSYNPDDPKDVRDKQVKQWQDWWAANRAAFAPVEKQ